MKYKPGDYINYYWIKDRQHLGYVEGDGWRLFLVLLVGTKWITLLNTYTLCACKVAKSTGLQDGRILTGEIKARLHARIKNTLKTRTAQGLTVSEWRAAKALELLEVKC